MGVTPMTSDMIPAENAFTRGLVQGGEGSMFGSGASRGEQYAARSKLVSNYLDRFGEYNPDDVVQSLTSTLRGRKNAAGEVIGDITTKMGNSPVNTQNSINAIDTSIAKLERLGTSANQGLLNSLRNLKGELQSPDLDFDLLRQHRTVFRSNVQGDAMVFPDQAKATTNMIENAMTRDLRSSVGKNLGPGEAANYIKAHIREPEDIYPVFRELFHKQAVEA